MQEAQNELETLYKLKQEVIDELGGTKKDYEAVLACLLTNCEEFNNKCSPKIFFVHQSL